MSKKLTTDLYLAASFLALGATLEKVDKSDPRHMVFELSKEDAYLHQNTNTNDANWNTLAVPLKFDDLDSYETAYANGVLLVNAIQFKDAIQRLKSIVHTR